MFCFAEIKIGIGYENMMVGAGFIIRCISTLTRHGNYDMHTGIHQTVVYNTKVCCKIEC